LPLKLVMLAGRHPKTVLSLAVLMLAASVLFARRITIDADMLSMIPKSNPVVSTFRDTITQFGSTDMLLVALEINRDAPLEAFTDYADNLAERLRDSERIRWVEYRLQDFAEAAEALLPHAALFMTESELEVFLSRLEPEGLQDHAQELAESLPAVSQIMQEPIYARAISHAQPFFLCLIRLIAETFWRRQG